MPEQITLSDFDDLESELFSQKFEKSEADNESEEDIKGLDQMSLSDMAITGTDWTVETVINQIKKGNIQLNPSFQRRDAWNNKVKSRFIESLFMGLPIPQIILAEQMGKKGKFIVIDGKQRLLSLKQFVLPDDNEKPLKLSGLEIKNKFNRMTYKDIINGLYYDDIDAFNNQTIRTIVIKNWKKVEVLYLLFLRLNTGSVKLSPQELRQALYPGDFIEYVNNTSSTNQSLKAMLNITKPDFRMRDVEILIRYYAFLFFAEDYSGSMQSFLDSTCDRLNKTWEDRQLEIKQGLQSFSTAVDLTIKIFSSESAFCKYKNDRYVDKYNRAVIDIMLYYFSQPNIQNASIEHFTEIKSAYQNLCMDDPEFLNALESTTKSLSAVHYRFRTWGETLYQILKVEVCMPKGY